MTREARDRPWGRVATALADGRWRVTGFSALAVLGASLAVQPLLDGGWWIPWTALTISVIALTGGLVRAMHLPAPLQPLVEAVVLLFSLTFLFARDEARWGFLPGPAAITRMRDLAAQGREYADTTQAPAALDTGLLLLIVAGIGLVALAVDTLAAGLDLPGMTLVPLGALFVAPWAINRSDAPGWTFVVVAASWFGVLSATQRERTSLWSPHARPGSPGVGLLVATAVTAVALMAGGLASLRGPVREFSPGAGGGDRSVSIDAMVSLRRSLVSNDARPVMTLATTAARPDYLRLAILEQFDGEQWSVVTPTQTGPLPPPLPDGSIPSAGSPPSGPLAEYQIDVGPLAGATLPSPAGTFQSLNDWPVQWDQRTSLPTRADGGTIEGTRIAFLTAAQGLDAEQLRVASTQPAVAGAEVFPETLVDPGPLVGQALSQKAREITAGSSTPFDAAVALQRWFTTDGRFTYSTQVEGGSDEDALTAFLEERVGYCEQFAATMALMARSVGIPSRVAVGFTQGRREGNQWVVRGTDAHAWPELWMGSAGWVRFEPTPGAPTTTTPVYTRSTAPEATTAPSASASASAATRPTKLPTEEPSGAGTATTEGGIPVLGIVLALTALLLLLPAAVRLVRRRRRIRTADGESAYREVVDTLVDLRLGSQAPTPRSTLAVVRTLVGAGPGAGALAESANLEEAIARIQRAVEWQRYGSPGAAAPATREPEPVDVAVPAGGQAAGVMVAERRDAAPSASRPGALARDIRVVRRGLAHRAGWVRRAVAALAPRSVLTGLGTRGAGRGGPNGG